MRQSLPHPQILMALSLSLSLCLCVRICPGLPSVFVGALLYLDPKTKMPMGIWKSLTKQLILPHEGLLWEHAKFYYRVAERSAIATLHVLESHYVWSQVIATANWQTFDHDHPLRTLLKPYTLNAHSTNSAAYNMLIREHGVLTHGSPFTTYGAISSLLVFWPHIGFNQTVPEWLEASNMKSVVDTDTIPLYNQGKRLYNVHRRFVEQFINQWYPSDEDLLKDKSVVRFWHHVNTYGRHLDPCVCGLSSEYFFDDNGVWPSFETTRTCKDLLDLAGFDTSKNEVTRRRDWCSSKDPFEKTTALYNMNVKICESNPNCSRLFWEKEMYVDDRFHQMIPTVLFCHSWSCSISGLPFAWSTHRSVLLLLSRSLSVSLPRLHTCNHLQS